MNVSSNDYFYAILYYVELNLPMYFVIVFFNQVYLKKRELVCDRSKWHIITI